MDALNYVGGSFDDPNCEQYYNEVGYELSRAWRRS